MSPPLVQLAEGSQDYHTNFLFSQLGARREILGSPINSSGLFVFKKLLGYLPCGSYYEIKKILQHREILKITEYVNIQYSPNLMSHQNSLSRFT